MDDYLLHMNRVTLLDHSLEVVPLTPKKPIVSRMLYAGRSPGRETSKDRLANYHQELLKKVAGRIEKVSGFLLIYPTCCLHLVEADTPTLINILKLMEADYIDSICVLSFSLDVPCRLFTTGWMAGFINSANVGPYDPYPQPGLLKAVSELNINMLKWGRHLSELDKDQQAAALESLRSTSEEFLPDDAGVVYSIILAEGIPKLNDVLELLDRPPKDIIFDSEILWPKPKLPIYL